MRDAAQDAAKVELLAEVPFLQFLDDKDRAALAADLDVVRFPAGKVLFNYGDPGDSLYVIRSGEVELFFKDDTGARIVLETARRATCSASCRCSTAARARPRWCHPGPGGPRASIAPTSSSSCGVTPRPRSTC